MLHLHQHTVYGCIFNVIEEEFILIQCALSCHGKHLNYYYSQNTFVLFRFYCEHVNVLI